MSPLQQIRLTFRPALPRSLHHIQEMTAFLSPEETRFEPSLKELFPNLSHHPIVEFQKSPKTQSKAHRVGVVFSGGQAAGGHNVIAGLFDALKILSSSSQLFGFLNGPSGIVNNKFIEITQDILKNYRNQGGFDLIGSGRTKIETPEQFQAAATAVKSLNLDGLVIIGGDDSNTNAAFLAEYFLSQKIHCNVIGVPKTIDGDLKNEFVEISFGFDSACKTYSEIIGNIMRDAISAKKYYYFIKLMGRTASHIVLECALQTHPNLAFIGEEVQEQGKTLLNLVHEICDMICERAEQKKDYGVVLIPEGIVEFIPEVKQLIDELNALLASDKPHSKKLDEFHTADEGTNYIMKFLSTPSVKCFNSFPKEIQQQMMLDRDPHGNVQVSRIETERLLMEMVKKELKARQKEGKYKGKLSIQPLFCGYEGRSCLPSNFDCQYCYALGYTAALLINSNMTGYMACVRDLTKPVEEWKIGGIPLHLMMTFEKRQGKSKPVIKKMLVDTKGPVYKLFKQRFTQWKLDDSYRYPGPIQFFGPYNITDDTTITLKSSYTTRGHVL